MPPALHSSLSSGSIITLLTTMALLAALPGVSVLAVTARSAGLGFRHGAATALGIVVGDLLFALLAILGLVLLLDSLGPLFRIIQLLGGTYLLWLSLKLWKAQPRTAASQQQSSTSLLNSFLTGLLITLADQ